MALLDEETGADIVRTVIFHSVVSAVTLAEAYSVLSFRGIDGLSALAEIRFAIEEIVPFTEEQAEIAGALREPTKHAGLSLGDRACLALALSLGAEVYTADHAWSRVEVGCMIHLIR